MNQLPKARTSEILVQELENELLVYDLKSNKAFCLNETSTLVFQLCDGTKTVAEISQTLNKQLKRSISEDLIWLALDSFKKDNLLEDGESIAIDFNGLNRRQVIKKIGFATMIALPLVSSVIAPTASHAASAPACPACFGVGAVPAECLPPPDPSIPTGGGGGGACRTYCESICCSRNASFVLVGNPCACRRVTCA